MILEIKRGCKFCDGCMFLHGDVYAAYDKYDPVRCLLFNEPLETAYVDMDSDSCEMAAVTCYQCDEIYEHD